MVQHRPELAAEAGQPLAVNVEGRWQPFAVGNQADLFEVMITDHGEPAYVLKALPQPVKLKASARDYHARLLQRQPKALSPKETRRFWEEERR